MLVYIIVIYIIMLQYSQLWFGHVEDRPLRRAQSIIHRRLDVPLLVGLLSVVALRKERMERSANGLPMVRGAAIAHALSQK